MKRLWDQVISHRRCDVTIVAIMSTPRRVLHLRRGDPESPGFLARPLLQAAVCLVVRGPNQTNLEQFSGGAGRNLAFTYIGALRGPFVVVFFSRLLALGALSKSAARMVTLCREAADRDRLFGIVLLSTLSSSISPSLLSLLLLSPTS